MAYRRGLALPVRSGSAGRMGRSSRRGVGSSDRGGGDSSSDAGSDYSGRGSARWADQDDDAESVQATSFGEGSVFSDDPLVEDRPEFPEEGVTYDVRPGFQSRGRERQRPVLAEVRADRGGGWIPGRELPTTGHAVFVQGSWGKPKTRLAEQVHLDLRTGPGTFLALQECTVDLEEALQQPSVDGDPSSADPLLAKKQYEYWTLRSDQDDLSCVLAGRKSHISELEMVLNVKRWDGKYRGGGGRQRARGSGEDRGSGEPGQRDCFTKYMVGRFHFHSNQLLAGKTHLTVLCVHLHVKTSRKAKGFRMAFDAIWPELAGVIKAEAVDVVSGNWGASLFQVIPRLREEGVHLQLGAWFPWARHGGGEVLVDTCGIFFYGSHQRPERVYQTFWECFQPAVAGAALVQAAVAADSDVDEEELRDEVPDANRFPRLQHFFGGQGHPLEWFFPGPPRSEEDMLSYVDEHTMVERWGPEEDYSGTMPPSREKPMQWTIWDSTGQLFRKGSHMPLACYLGYKNQGRRSAVAAVTRDARDQYYQARAAGDRGGGGGGGGRGGGWNRGGGGGAWNSGGGTAGGWDRGGGAAGWSRGGGGNAWYRRPEAGAPAGSGAAGSRHPGCQPLGHLAGREPAPCAPWSRQGHFCLQPHLREGQGPRSRQPVAEPELFSRELGSD